MTVSSSRSGRPRKYDKEGGRENALSSYATRLDATTRSRLKSLARQRNQSLIDLFSEAVQKLLDERPDLTEAFVWQQAANAGGDTKIFVINVMLPTALAARFDHFLQETGRSAASALATVTHRLLVGFLGHRPIVQQRTSVDDLDGGVEPISQPGIVAIKIADLLSSTLPKSADELDIVIVRLAGIVRDHLDKMTENGRGELQHVLIEALEGQLHLSPNSAAATIVDLVRKMLTKSAPNSQH